MMWAMERLCIAGVKTFYSYLKLVSESHNDQLVSIYRHLESSFDSTIVAEISEQLTDDLGLARSVSHPSRK